MSNIPIQIHSALQKRTLVSDAFIIYAKKLELTVPLMKFFLGPGSLYVRGTSILPES